MVGETLYEIQNLRVAKSGADLVVGGIGPGIEQVSADGVVEEMGILSDDADTLVDRVELQVADIDAADADDATLRVVEARDEVGDGGLAGAGGSDQRDQLAGSNVETDVVEDGFLRAIVGNRDGFERRERDFGGRGIAEGDAVELDGGGTGRDGDGLGAFPDHGGKIEDFEDSLEGDQRGHDADLDVGKADERGVEAAKIGGERDDGADVKNVMDSKDASPSIGQRRGGGGDDGQRGEEEAAVDGQPDADVGNTSGFLAEDARVFSGRPKSFDNRAPATLKRSTMRCPFCRQGHRFRG